MPIAAAFVQPVVPAVEGEFEFGPCPETQEGEARRPQDLGDEPTRRGRYRVATGRSGGVEEERGGEEKGRREEELVDFGELKEKGKKEKEKEDVEKKSRGDPESPVTRRLGGKKVAKKSLEHVFRGTGMDPDPKRRKKVIRKVKRVLKQVKSPLPVQAQLRQEALQM